MIDRDRITYAELEQLNEQLIARIDEKNAQIITLMDEKTILKRDLVDEQGSADYSAERATNAIQVALKLQATLDQALAHIESLENRVRVLTEMVDESDFAISTAAETLQGQIFASLIYLDEIVPDQRLDGEEGEL